MTRKTEIIRECQRLSESCLYTSTTLFIWLRSKRRLKIFFTATPLILGSIAGWKLLTDIDSEYTRYIISIMAFVAGILPTVYSALKLDDQLETCERLSAEFKNLQDRFRQVALISSKKEIRDFEEDFKSLFNRFEIARESSITPPERFFKAAQAKIKEGDYKFDVDIEE